MAFLVHVTGFTFEGHLSNWKIYDLKEQFSKLAPWNMNLPTVHFVLFFFSDLYEQKIRELTCCQDIC